MGTARTIRRALRLVGDDRRRRFYAVAFLGLVVSLLEALAAILVLVLLQLVLSPSEVPDLPLLGDPSRFFPDASRENLVTRFAVVFGVFFVVRGGLFLFQRYALSRVVENSGVLLSDRLVDGYLSMPYEFHLRRNSSELIRNAYDNVDQVVRGVFTPLADLLAESVLVGVMLGVLFLASPLATGGAVALVGATVALTLFLVQPALVRLGARRQAAAKSALQHLQQGLGGLRDIKVLGRERAFSRSFRRARAEMAASQYMQSTLAYTPRVAIETVFLLVLLAALAVATHRDAAASALSTLGLFAYAGMRVQPSVQKVAGALNSLRYSDAAIADLEDDLRLLDSNAVRREGDHQEIAALTFRRSIEFSDLSFTYAGAERAALCELDFTIEHGASVGIAGPTGGGKSTLTDLLCGLLLPSQGRILVDGTDIAAHSRAWQRNIGVAHQTSFLIDDSIRRNIALGVPDDAIDEDALLRAMDIAQLRPVVADLPDGLDTLVGERGVRLSGGQRQRVTLARAIYRQPSLLVLDEGTSALDNATEAAVMRGLAELQGEVTVVMVAHRLQTIVGCDSIIYVEGGRVAGMGTYEDLHASNASFRAMAG